MNYSITINQKAQCDLGLEEQLDLIDHAIFEHCIKFSLSKKITSMQEDGKTYYWFSYKHILNENPALKNMIKSKDGVYRRMKKMCDLGIFDIYPGSKSLSQSFYAFGDLAAKLSGLVPNDNPSGSESDAYGHKSEGGPSDTETMNHNTNSFNHTTKSSTDSEKTESYSSPLNEKSGNLDSEKDTSNLDEQWLNENEKKEKTSGKKEKKDELWVRLVDTYFRWYKEFNDDIPPKFSGKGAGPERQQMKYLKEHLIDISKGDEEKAANTFEYISKNWKRLDKFYHDKYEIKFIYSQISKIIAYFKQKQDGQSPPTSMEDFLQYHWERTGKNTSE